jgi:hypothetical protein
MKKILVLLTLIILTFLILSSGCSNEPAQNPIKKYTDTDNSNNYIILNSTDKTVLIHKGSMGNYTGTYKENNTDYTFSFYDGSTQMYKILNDNSICMVQTQKKYVDPSDSSTYIVLNIIDKSYMMVKYGVSLGGRYQETDTDYTLFPNNMPGGIGIPLKNLIMNISDCLHL